MAATGLFIGASESWLLATKQTAMDRYASGLIVVSYSDSGSSVSKQLTAPPSAIIAECNHALYVLDPATYKNLRRQSCFASRYDTRSL
jgi:hypothetical protein